MEVEAEAGYRNRVRIGAIVVLAVAVLTLLLTLKGLKVYPALTGPSFSGRYTKTGQFVVPDCNTTIECTDRPDIRTDVACNELLAPIDPMRSNLIVRDLLPQDCSKARGKGAKKRACEPLGSNAEQWLLRNAAEKLRLQTGVECPVRLFVRHEQVVMPLDEPLLSKRVTVDKEYRLE